MQQNAGDANEDIFTNAFLYSINTHYCVHSTPSYTLSTFKCNALNTKMDIGTSLLPSIKIYL